MSFWWGLRLCSEPPVLKSGSACPSLSTLCTGKMAREDTHLGTDVVWEARERHCDVARTWCTDMSSCWCSCTVRHVQAQHAQQRVPCYVFVDSQSCTHRCMAQGFPGTSKSHLSRLCLTRVDSASSCDTALLFPLVCGTPTGLVSRVTPCRSSAELPGYPVYEIDRKCGDRVSQ